MRFKGRLWVDQRLTLAASSPILNADWHTTSVIITCDNTVERFCFTIIIAQNIQIVVTRTRVKGFIQTSEYGYRWTMSGRGRLGVSQCYLSRSGQREAVLCIISINTYGQDGSIFWIDAWQKAKPSMDMAKNLIVKILKFLYHCDKSNSCLSSHAWNSFIFQILSIYWLYDI